MATIERRASTAQTLLTEMVPERKNERKGNPTVNDRRSVNQKRGRCPVIEDSSAESWTLSDGQFVNVPYQDLHGT